MSDVNGDTDIIMLDSNDVLETSDTRTQKQCENVQLKWCQSIEEEFKVEPGKEKIGAGMSRRLLSIDECRGSEEAISDVPDGQTCKVSKGTHEDSNVKDMQSEGLKPNFCKYEGMKEIARQKPDSDLHNEPSTTKKTADPSLEALISKGDITADNDEMHKDIEKVERGTSCCCIKIQTAPLNKVTWPPKFKLKDLLIALLGFFTFVFDYVTDILLLSGYFKNNNMLFFYLTLGFICVPSIISGIISALWYKMYYRRDKRKKYNHAKRQYYIRTIASFLQLGRLWRQAEYIYCVAHSIRIQSKKGREKEDEKLRLRATEEKRDAAILGLIDGFMESAMQLLLQIYLTVHYNLEITYWRRLLALLSSWLSTSMIITTYYRSNRRALREKKNLDYFSSLFYLLWRLCELGPRYILLGLTIAYFRPWVFVVAVCHVIFVAVLYKRSKAELGGICEDPVADKKNEAFTHIESEENSGKESEPEKNREGCRGCGIPRYLFLFVISFIGLLSFINLREGKTRYVTFIYYVVYYVENIIMVALIIFVGMLSTPECYILIVTPVGIVGHLAFAGLFYYLFHPGVSGKRRIIVPSCMLISPCAKT